MKKRRLKKKAKYFLLSVLLAAGVVLLIYPFAADYINAKRQRAKVESYVTTVQASGKNENDRLLQAAQAYNEALAKTGIRWDLMTASGILRFLSSM